MSNDAVITAPDVTPDVDPETTPDEFDTVIGLTLADAIREGSKETSQAYGWGDGVANACALTAAGMVIKKKGYRTDAGK